MDRPGRLVCPWHSLQRRGATGAGPHRHRRGPLPHQQYEAGLRRGAGAGNAGAGRPGGTGRGRFRQQRRVLSDRGTAGGVSASPPARQQGRPLRVSGAENGHPRQRTAAGTGRYRPAGSRKMCRPVFGGQPQAGAGRRGVQPRGRAGHRGAAGAGGLHGGAGPDRGQGRPSGHCG